MRSASTRHDSRGDRFIPGSLLQPAIVGRGDCGQPNTDRVYSTRSPEPSLSREPRLINGQTVESDSHCSELAHGLIQILALEVDDWPMVRCGL